MLRIRHIAVFYSSLLSSQFAFATAIEWPVSNGGNGHYYDFVLGNLSWTDARTDAENRAVLGVSGHLATVTSVEEKEHIRLNLPNRRGWIGGFQDTSSPDYSEPDRGWRWITGERWRYTNWAFPEPNEFRMGENFLEVDPAADSPDGFGWNDQEETEVFNVGYYIEYPVPEPSSAITAAISVLLLTGIRRIATRRPVIAVSYESIVLACGLCFCSANTSVGQPAVGPWTQLGYDQQRTGRSHLVGPRFPRLLWTSEIADFVSIAPAVSPDGTIITTSYADGGSLVSISPDDGSVLWVFSSRDTSNATPTIGADGSIYFGDSDDWFYAVDSNGSLIWEYLAEDDVWSSPLLRDDNSIIFTTDGHGSSPFIHARDGATGNEIWTTTAPRGDLNNPILGHEGRIFANAGGGTILHSVRAFDADGTSLWSNSDVHPLDGDHGAVGPNGTVFYGSTDGMLAAIHPASGQSLWLTDVGNAHILSPAIGADGTVYAAGTDGVLRAFDPSHGNVLWAFNAGKPASTRVSVDAEGTIYFAAQETLFAVTDDGAELWRFELPTRTEDTTPVIGDGVIYIAGRSGPLYALIPEPTSMSLLFIGLFILARIRLA